nr:cystathionine gamma-lyase [Thermoleophilaceae bacterium]
MSHDPATRVVRAGLPAPEQGEPFLPGPQLAAPFHLRGDPAEVESVYGRYGNPTWTLYERALGELELAEVVLYASGMAAAAALLLTGLKPGSVLAVDADCYLNVRRLAMTHLEPRGVEVRLASFAELGDALRGAHMLWLESPSNPKLEVYDIEALAGAARAEGAVTVVDNTTAGPLYQHPLDLGADAVITSATKHLSGHADLVLGYVALRDPARAQELRDWRRDAGSIPGPFEAWLAHRSLPTLGVRLERGCANALALAKLLAARNDVEGVRYPGLASDPGHEVARRQMSGFGTVLCFDVGGRERAERFLAAAELITEATSFGSVHTCAERRARWGGDEVPEGFIRLSAGCEHTPDLLADVER